MFDNAVMSTFELFLISICVRETALTLIQSKGNPHRSVNDGCERIAASDQRLFYLSLLLSEHRPGLITRGGCACAAQSG